MRLPVFYCRVDHVSADMSMRTARDSTAPVSESGSHWALLPPRRQLMRQTVKWWRRGLFELGRRAGTSELGAPGGFDKKRKRLVGDKKR